MRHKPIFLLLINSFLLLGIYAQQPLNLDFEKRSVEAFRPWGWESTSWGAPIFSLDSTTLKQGNYSFRAACQEECEAQSFRFGMESLDLKGKTITLHGFIKGLELEQVFNVSIQYTNKVGEEFLEKEFKTKDFSGSFDWTPFTLSVEIPSSVVFVYVHLNMQGQGSAWVDDMELLVENQKLKALRAAKAFSKANQDWFYQNTRHFSSPYPSEAFSKIDKKDLKFFKKAVGKSQLVALGESTHGTREFFTLKHKLLQYAVEELGFRVFAIEDHQLFARAVDQYIKTGKGTAKASMKGLFAVWNRQEVLDMIVWLRNYNLQHPDDMVSFIGFDMQNVNPSIQHLETFLTSYEPSLFAELQASLDQLKEQAQQIFFTRNTVVKQKWVDEAMAIYDGLNNKKETWLRNARSAEEIKEIHYGIQYARLITQFFQEGLHNGEELYRDQAMAENLNWYLQYIQPGAKVFIWAHDVHIARGEHPQALLNLHQGKSMGGLLAKKYADNYKSFGISSYTGTYRAFKTYAYQELIASPLFASPKGTIEEALHQVAIQKGRSNLFLSLAKAKDWLNKPIPVRFANHVSFDYGHWQRIVVPAQFDGIFFIDKTSSAKLINK